MGGGGIAFPLLVLGGEASSQSIYDDGVSMRSTIVLLAASHAAYLPLRRRRVLGRVPCVNAWRGRHAVRQCNVHSAKFALHILFMYLTS